MATLAEKFGLRKASGVGEAGWGHTLIVALVSLMYFLPVLMPPESVSEIIILGDGDSDRGSEHCDTLQCIPRTGGWGRPPQLCGLPGN